VPEVPGYSVKAKPPFPENPIEVYRRMPVVVGRDLQDVMLGIANWLETGDNEGQPVTELLEFEYADHSFTISVVPSKVSDHS